MFGFKKSKIDFIVAGVQKAGTTALDVYLREHPQIEMGKVKEIHFFDDYSNFVSEKPNYNTYHNYFNLSIKKKVFGEVTPIYFYWKPSIERIFNYNKKIKLIIILRNPIDRAFSHWNMEVSRNNESRDFYTCIKEDLVSDKQDRITSYVQRGFYSVQIERMFKFFDKNQILFIKYEDFVKEQKASLDIIFNFLDVKSELFNFKFKNIHKTDYKNKIELNSKELLLDVYKDDIEKVESFLNWNCNTWKS